MIGSMRHRVTFKTPTVTVSATGGTTTVLDTAGTVWASVTKKNGDYKQDTTDRIVEGIKAVVRKNTTTDAVTKDTVMEFDGDDYSITNISEVEYRGFYYEIEATK
jgi:SPP1 family predicted phage head-tail adaptor